LTALYLSAEVTKTHSFRVLHTENDLEFVLLDCTQSFKAIGF